MTGYGMRKFTEDFKREAVRLVQSSGRTIEQVADDLAFDVGQVACQAS